MATKVRNRTAFGAWLGSIVKNTVYSVLGIEVVPDVDFYIHATNGNDTTGTGTKLNPYKSFAKAFQVATVGQTFYAYRGLYVESQQAIIKDGVNFIGGGKDKESGTRISVTYVSPNQNQPYLGKWWAAVSETDLHEEQGNVFSNFCILGNLNVDASVFVNNRSNFVMHNFEAYDCGVNFIEFRARRDFGLMPPNVVFSSTYNGITASRTFPYAKGNKLLFCKIENCGAWQTNNTTNTLWLQGKNNGGYGAGSVTYGGQDGFEAGYFTVDNSKRGHYQEGFTFKGAQHGHNMNDDIHHGTCIRPQFNQYYGSINIENWGCYGGANYRWVKFYGGAVDFNDGNKNMTINPTANYAARVRFCTMESDVAADVLGQTFDTNMQVDGTFAFQKTGISLEVTNGTGNYFDAETAAILSDVTIEFCRFKNYSQAYYYYIHGATSLVTRIKFRCNLLINSGRGFMNCVSGVQNTAVVEDIEDYHNTSYNTNSAILDGHTMGFAGQVRNVKLKNNITQGFSRSPVRIESVRAGSTLDNFSEVNNLYYSCGNSNVTSNAGGAAATNLTASNLTPANPNFVDAANGNFKLASKINGTPLGVITDIDGKIRDQSVPTIGAYE